MVHLVSKHSWAKFNETLLYVGYVFEALDENRNLKVAIKRTQKAGKIASREYEVMNMLRGVPNIV